MSGQEESAGGMSYRTMKGIDASIMEHLVGNDEKSSAEIFEKNQSYYIASADKIMARLELTGTRINHTKLPEEDVKFLCDKVSHGLKWLETLKKNIKQAKNDCEFSNAISYKKWHAVKLIPSAAEGYAISIAMEGDLKHEDIIANVKQLKDAKSHVHKAKDIFSELLNLKENSDFKLAEERRIKAYKELNLIQELLRTLK
jgi:hypothetical protein